MVEGPNRKKREDLELFGPRFSATDRLAGRGLILSRFSFSLFLVRGDAGC